MKTYTLPFHRQLTLVENKTEYQKWAKENCIEDESIPAEFPAIVYYTISGEKNMYYGQVVAPGGVRSAIEKLEELESQYSKGEKCK